MAYLEVADLYKSFGEGVGKVSVLNGVHMTVEQGEICTILGPSGSGKSTLLNVIGGLDSADRGSIRIDGRDIVPLKEEQHPRENQVFFHMVHNQDYGKSRNLFLLYLKECE